MPDCTFHSDTLVCVTTYAGGFETRLILKKILRHFRWRNGSEIPLLLVSDGPVDDEEILGLVDIVDQRPGPSGLQGGELESLQRMVEHARKLGVRTVVKICGDVILDRANWVDLTVGFLQAKGRSMLSTHWFEHDSDIVGTKFFVAELDFLANVLPARLDGQALEHAITKSINQFRPVEESVWLINSCTGEADEVEAELTEWRWEHAHKLYKFRHLDDNLGTVSRVLLHAILYPVLRLHHELCRTFRRLSHRSLVWPNKTAKPLLTADDLN